MLLLCYLIISETHFLKWLYWRLCNFLPLPNLSLTVSSRHCCFLTSFIVSNLVALQTSSPKRSETFRRAKLATRRCYPYLFKRVLLFMLYYNNDIEKVNSNRPTNIYTSLFINEASRRSCLLTITFIAVNSLFKLQATQKIMRSRFSQFDGTRLAQVK